MSLLNTISGVSRLHDGTIGLFQRLLMLGDVREPTSHLCPVDCTVTTDTSLDDVLKADVVTTDGQVHQSRIVREILEGLDLGWLPAVLRLVGDVSRYRAGAGDEMRLPASQDRPVGGLRPVALRFSFVQVASCSLS